MQAHFCLETLCVFHVKRPQGERSDHTCVGIAEPQDVGHEVSQPNEASEAATNIFVAISEPIKVGLWLRQSPNVVSTAKNHIVISTRLPSGSRTTLS